MALVTADTPLDPGHYPSASCLIMSKPWRRSSLLGDSIYGSVVCYEGTQHRSLPRSHSFLIPVKVIYASRTIYLLIITAIKFSILFFYLRLSPPTTFHRWVKTTMVACGVEGVLFISMALFQCTPVQSFWNSAVPGHCISILAFFRAETAFNLVTNVAIILLPMPMVWRLHMALRRRILLTGIFASGVM